MVLFTTLISCLDLIIILQITGEGDKLRMSYDFQYHYYLNGGFHLKVRLASWDIRLCMSICKVPPIRFDQLNLKCDILCT